jgi:glutathione S-transferase
MAVKFTYFALWAKGPACAVALEKSSLSWEGANPDNWKAQKATTPWRELPILEIPGAGTIGHELAILNYIGRQDPKMAGESEKDYLASQQLLFEAEDIYKSLGQKQDTLFAKDKIPKEELAKFWGEPDQTTHNKDFGIGVYLQLLEEFYAKCAAGDGKFTTSGCTVGECKLWATLHMLKMIKEDVLAPFAGVLRFYTRFSAEPEAQKILTTGGAMGKPFAQYFVAPA